MRRTWVWACWATGLCGAGACRTSEGADTGTRRELAKDAGQSDSGQCGNGRIDAWDDGLGHRGVEDCDDGNDHDGDGCSAACYVESGFVCSDGEPTQCSEEEDRSEAEEAPLTASPVVGTVAPATGVPIAPGVTPGVGTPTAVAPVVVGPGGAPGGSPDVPGGAPDVLLGPGGAPPVLAGGPGGVGIAGRGDGGMSMGGVEIAGRFGVAGDIGIGGAIPGSCPNGDPFTLFTDSSLEVHAECNTFGIAGSFTCFHDTVAPVACVDSRPSYRPGEGVCLSGSTIVDPDLLAWGAGISLSLNAEGADLQPYDATANGLVGVETIVTGTAPPGLTLRVNVVDEVGSSIAPFVDFPGPGALRVDFESAMVPSTWDVPEAGKVPDPSHLYELQLQVLGGQLAADYDVCIESIRGIAAQ